MGCTLLRIENFQLLNAEPESLSAKDNKSCSQDRNTKLNIPIAFFPDTPNTQYTNEKQVGILQ